MLQFIPVHEGNLFAVKATGKLTHADYQAFLPELEKLISEHGKISLLLELEDFSGWELAAAKDDMQFGFKHKYDFEKIALVGDKAWHQWMALMAKPFMDGEVRYFSRDELQTAWDWLRDKKQHADTSGEVTPSQPYQHIIVAVDFSPHSEKAAYRAMQVAERFSAKLTLLTVVDDVEFYYAYLEPMDMNALTQPYDPELVASLAESAHKLAEQNLNKLVKKIKVEQAQT